MRKLNTKLFEKCGHKLLLCAYNIYINKFIVILNTYIKIIYNKVYYICIGSVFIRLMYYVLSQETVNNIIVMVIIMIMNMIERMIKKEYWQRCVIF